MTVLVLLGAAIVLHLLAARFYARYISRRLGEDRTRTTPALEMNDGRDYVPTSTHVVFGHHFASIAGAGPIVGPLIGLIYGWGPAWLWVVFGAIFMGAVHDYTALYVSMRAGGRSLAEVAKQLMGKWAYTLVIAFTIIMLLLVTAVFLNLSAGALTAKLPVDILGLGRDDTTFRIVVDQGVEKAQVGGIASMSVIVITLLAPLLGLLYYRKKLPVWLCSLLALGICALSVFIGLKQPVILDGLAQTLGGWFPAWAGWISAANLWKLLLSLYVLLAAGVPVWFMLQPRDFINVHILYFGLLLMAVGVVAAGFSGAQMQLPMSSVVEGSRRFGWMWPVMFITIACGAISGFHSLCAGGTSSKQVISEPAARRVGYWAMLLESLLAVCVICVVCLGLSPQQYHTWVHAQSQNQVAAFAYSVGKTVEMGLHFLPVSLGTVLAMLILEGFIITTLDTAVRLNRYLFEELWRTLFRNPPKILAYYWVNSALAVALMLWFANSGTVELIWKLFGTANQLLAALVLIIVTFWLLERGKKTWFTFIPAMLMLVTTVTMLVMILVWPRSMLKARPDDPLLVFLIADWVLLLLTGGIVVVALRKLRVLARARTSVENGMNSEGQGAPPDRS